ncbi:MAG TPA: sigma-70 family RNA polymerase sigma factor [Candidatus Dormibacteraeota bacterium]
MIAAAALRSWELERMSDVLAAREARVIETPLEFEEVYRRHASPLYRYCLSQLGDPQLAEDVAADAFTAAFAAYPRVRPDPAGVRAWLFRIARNAAIDQRRRGFRGRRASALLAAGSAEAASVETRAELRGDLRAVVTAVAALSRRERQLVGLRIAAGLPYGEVGAVMGMSEASARQATHRALAKVRAWVTGEA